MRVGSLFSGVGGIDLGLEVAGMTVAWQVERDRFCQEVLRKHWPHVPLYDDVQRVCGPLRDPTRAGRTEQGGLVELARVDLIAGGFP